MQALVYPGGYSILKDYLTTLRPVVKPEPLIRFETDPSRQMQADFAIIRRGRDRLAVFIATRCWAVTSERSTSSAEYRAGSYTTTCARW